MNPKRLLLTRFPYESVLSGEEWHTITLCQELLRRGYDVHFMGSCPVLLKELPTIGVTCHPVWGGILPVSKKALLLFFCTWPFIVFNLYRHFLQIHRSTPITSCYMLSLTEKVLLTPLLLWKRITTVWVEHQRFGAWFFQNPLLALYRLWSKHVPIITVSNDHASLLKIAHIHEKQLHVITNGIDTSFFSPHSATKNEVFHIGTVARLSYDKGVDILIHATARLIKEHPEKTIHLTIQGEGPDRTSLEQLCNDLGIASQVTFYTPYTEVPRSKMPEFYSNLSCFVLPSRLHDPFGLVVAEAMACGVPTIATTACGITSQLIHRQHALIIPPEQPEKLTGALEELMHTPDLVHHLSNEGRAHAEATFSLRTMVDHYIPLLFTSHSPLS